MGVAVESSLVTSAAFHIGCSSLTAPFSYLGVNVGGHMSRIASWNGVINKVLNWLSKWKMKVLSAGGRLTLLKSVLGAVTLYYMSLFIAPMQVIKKLESIRCHFFNGVEPSVRKMALFKWDNVLAAKEMGALGVLSFFTLNRVLVFKWVWRFRSQGAIKKKVGNGDITMFWEDPWKGEVIFKDLFPRLYALKMVKSISVVNKLMQPTLVSYFRCNVRGGVEQFQLVSLQALLEGLILPNASDRWIWSMSGDGEFSVSSVRNLIDEKTIGSVGTKTRWSKFVLIKVNSLSWRVKHDNLPTRFNLSRRGLDLPSIFCPTCNNAVESSDHLFFRCTLAIDLYACIARWWDVFILVLSSYEY
nr:RNA-directed DNA polymerase, eukaryota, reverse transcriptase zinc-binding domain protein [Tanacetum cinerariifolium]